jgi:hypothetical protein
LRKGKVSVQNVSCIWEGDTDSQIRSASSSEKSSQNPNLNENDFSDSSKKE